MLDKLVLANCMIFPMGTLNLLKANYIGKVGQTVGTTYKGKSIIKAKVDGKHYPSNAQIDALTAFGRLNRVCSQVAKKFWPYCGLTDKKLLRHNVLSSYFSPAIAGRFFDPLALQLPNLHFPLLQIASFSSPDNGKNFFLTLNNSLPQSSWAEYKIFIVIFDIEAILFYTEVLDIFDGIKNIKTNAYGGGPFYCWLLLAHCPTSKFSLIGSTVAEVSGMQYSTDEQETGDYWLDGRPIYQKTYVKIVDRSLWVPGNNFVSFDDTFGATNELINLMQYQIKSLTAPGDNREAVGMVGVPANTVPSTSYFGPGISNLGIYRGATYPVGALHILHKGVNPAGTPYTGTVQYTITVHYLHT